MAWQCYKLVYRLESPLRIGAGEIGNLQPTRKYVPGRVVWAALTARLTRNQGMGVREADYRSVGDILQKNMRFGYLWPSLDRENPCFPWEDPSGFDYKFLDSYISTSLDYDAQSALDGSLHEAEYVAPQTRDKRPVFLVGWLWVRTDIPHQSWQKALHHVVLGGERRYGWGRVSLMGDLALDSSPPILDPDHFSWEQAAVVPAHVLFTSAAKGKLSGVIEPLVGWEARDNGIKSIGESVFIAYAPGSKLKPETPLRISEQPGLWEVLPK
jgi:hypothetical protein